MSSAIQDLQKAILDPNQSLTQLLRRTKVIASELNFADVETWVDQELDGYSVDTESPNYGEISSEALEVRNPYEGWQFAGYHRVTSRVPISAIEDMAKQEMLSAPIEQRFNVPIGDG